MKEGHLRKSFQQFIAKKLINLSFQKKISWVGFENEFENRLNRLSYGFVDFEPTFYLAGLGTQIRFNEVEKILTPIFIKHQIAPENHNFHNARTVIWSLRNEKEEFKKIRTTKIANEEDLEKLLGVIEWYIDEKILPFFEKYQDLEEVNNRIKEIPVKELSKFLGNEVVGKRMVIMYLLNDPEYSEYYDRVNKYYLAEANKGKKDFEKKFLLYTEINKVLINMVS